MKDQIFEVAQGDAAMGMGVAILALLIVVVPLAILAFVGGKLGGAKGAFIAGLLGAGGGVAYLCWVYYDLGNYFVRRERPTVEVVVPEGYTGRVWIFYEMWQPIPATVAPRRYRVAIDEQGRGVMGPLPDHERLFAATRGPAHEVVTPSGARLAEADEFNAGGSFPIPGDKYVMYDQGYVGTDPEPHKHIDAQELYLAMKKETEGL